MTPPPKTERELTPEEREVLDIYRRTPKHQRAALIRVGEVFAEDAHEAYARVSEYVH